MQQQMTGGVSLAPLANGLCRRVRAPVASSLISRAVVVPLGGRPARLVGGRVTAAHGAARSKDSRLRGAAAAVIAAPETSCQLPDQRAPTVNASSTQQLSAISKIKFFEVEMKVRDDELDEYGVVNNAIYASYIHRGRDALLEHLGISVDYWASTGCAMAISELNLKYFLPLRSGDRFVVKVRPVQNKGVRMIIHHLIEMLPDHKPVLEARGTVVFLNKDYRPTRVFPEVAAKAQEMFGCKEA